MNPPMFAWTKRGDCEKTQFSSHKADFSVFIVLFSGNVLGGNIWNKFTKSANEIFGSKKTVVPSFLGWFVE